MTALLFCSAACGPAAGQLNYTERSNGLGTPGLEGGNTELEFGDVNGDGHLDLVSVGDHGSPYVNTQEHGVMVWFGDGAGQWSVFQYGNFGYGGVALGDVNGDGLMDVGYGVHHNYSGVPLGDQILEVALGDGTGRMWTAWDAGLATNGETWGMFGTDFADVDHDGDFDLGSISFGCCAGVHIYRNNGNGSWTQTFGFVGGNSTMLFEFGEINGDGHADFACGHGQGNGTVYLGNGAGGFTPADGDLPPAGNGGRAGMSLGEVDGDGRDDLAFVTGTGIGVYRWLGAGHWQNLSGSLANVGAAKLTQIADMDGDGHGDIVALFLGRVVVYGGDGQGNWQVLADVATAAACDFAALRAGSDFDHNGRPDFAYIAEENCQPWTGGVNRLHGWAEATTPAAARVVPSWPRGGETLIAGSVHFLDWHATVPAGAGQPGMTIELSTAGPTGPWRAVVAGAPNNGRYQYVLPRSLPSSERCYLRCTLHTTPPAAALTPGPFRIVNPSGLRPGDLNCDGAVNFDDINPFVLALSDPAGYAAAYPNCNIHNGDCNGDGVVNFDDINAFVALLASR
ncbi:MAG: FG-GAP-like repeat-containing protein [Planctomycetota bacterium]